MASSAWGRRDMSQYPTESTVDSINTINSPQPLSPLPNQSAIREVWTGSEFTVVADEEGLVWSCGWNEHGNLGRGKGINDPNCNDVDDFRSSDNWVAVMRLRSNVQEGKNDDDMYEHLRLTVVWEGVLSCGGGHVLCLTD
jgi:alpha-tubulin suppressor-like RCC1 family protein